MKDTSTEVLAIIPARAGSKRVPKKNIRRFLGKPLIAYAIAQALESPVIDRVIVDTDSEEVARIAKKHGADVPFLRPWELATDTAQVTDAILHLLDRLKRDEGYVPTHVVILQTTSPLRELPDIAECWKLMRESDATTVLTVCPTHPRFYHLTAAQDLVLVNAEDGKSTNVQAWPQGYMLNGCFVYIVKTDALRAERSVITKKTKAVVCEKWRSVDIDTPEDWVMAELLYKNRKAITRRIKKI